MSDKKNTKNEKENIRLTIIVGVVAMALGVILYNNDDPGYSGLLMTLKIFSSFFILLGLSYIMLTGLLLRYKSREPLDRDSNLLKALFKKTRALLVWVRKRTYNASVGFYWLIFLVFIYQIITTLFGVSDKWKSILINGLGVLALSPFIIAFVSMIVSFVLRKHDSKTS